jgi:hypothetical protein
MAERQLQVGDLVKKTGGDFAYRGTVVSVFRKLAGIEKVVVESKEGVLHIFSPGELTLLPPKPPKLTLEWD